MTRSIGTDLRIKNTTIPNYPKRENKQDTLCPPLRVTGPVSTSSLSIVKVEITSPGI